MGFDSMAAQPWTEHGIIPPTAQGTIVQKGVERLEEPGMGRGVVKGRLQTCMAIEFINSRQVWSPGQHWHKTMPSITSSYMEGAHKASALAGEPLQILSPGRRRVIFWRCSQ